MSPEEILRTPSPRVWYIYGTYLDYEYHMKKEVIGDTEIIADEEFGEDWEKTTAPPQWWIDRQEKENGRTDRTGTC